MSRSVQQVIEDALADFNPSYGIEENADNTILVRKSEQTGNYELSSSILVPVLHEGVVYQAPTGDRDAVWVNTERAGLMHGMKLEGFKLVQRR